MTSDEVSQGRQDTPRRGWKPRRSGSHECRRVPHAGQGADRIRRDHWRRPCKTGRDVEVGQTSVALDVRRLVFPAEADVERQPSGDTEAVVDVCVVDAATNPCPWIPESNRARRRDAQEEIGEGAASRGAGERQRAARIRLRVQIEMVQAGVGAEREVVTAAPHLDLAAGHMRRPRRALVIAAAKVQQIREGDRRRTPVARILIVADDPGVARDVDAIGEERGRLAGDGGETVARARVDSRRDTAGPAHVRRDRRLPAGVGEIKHVRRAGDAALEPDRPAQHRTRAEIARCPHLQGVGRRLAHNWPLQVRPRGRGASFQRVVLQQRRRLGRDAFGWNDVAGKRFARLRIANDAGPGATDRPCAPRVSVRSPIASSRNAARRADNSVASTARTCSRNGIRSGPPTVRPSCALA